MNNTIKRIPVNGTRLRAARLALGLGTRELARDAGATFTLIDSMEKDNFAGASITLAELRGIARAAGLTLADLLDDSTAAPTREGHAPDEHVRQLAAVLMAYTRMQRNDDICQALGWTLPHLLDTADRLSASLAPVGLRVHQQTGVMCLRPATPEAHELAKSVDARRTGREGINASEANYLRQAISGELSDKLPKTAHPQIGHLINLGYLKPGGRGEPLHVPTEAARYAFEVS